MKNLEKTKIILGSIMIGLSLVGMLGALSYQFYWYNEYSYSTPLIFGYGNEGGASNTPIFYGLMAIAGSILLINVKKEN